MIAANRPYSCRMIACAEWASPGRSSNGFRWANIIARFGPLPMKLKPLTENSESMSGNCFRIASACRVMLFVYCSDAPSGPCTVMKK